VKSGSAREVPRVVVHLTRSMRRGAEAGAVVPQELLSTSPRAFGLRSIEGAATWKDAPQKHAGDLAGPLTLAMASERPKAGSAAPHGPRLVVTGSSDLLSGLALREAAAFRGGALLAESAVSWLASRPQILDVPEKAPVGAGMHIDEASRAVIRRYVVFFMPGTVALLGLAIALFRRAGEGKAPTRRGPKGAGEGSAEGRGKKRSP
jgi:hypothetical protein